MWTILRITKLLLVALFSLVCSSVTATVSYDDKAIIINGQRRILISGSIHYPRSTPEVSTPMWLFMWPDLIQKAKDGGLDVIQTYVFWNGHEPSPGKYYFKGSYDLVKFIKLIQLAGLYVHLRIGPYVCAEWNFGGFPVWLKYVPGIEFRTDNQPFKIENEYGPVEWEIGAPGKAYTKWAAKMAVGLGTGVPWIMCKQEDAPDPLVSILASLINPKCGQKSGLAVEVLISLSVGFQYHGGTNFGRTSAGLFVATSYDYDAPIDEYGSLRGPKWGHLRDLHKAIKLCEPALVSAYPTVTWLGNNLEAHVFNSKSGACAAFLSNYDPKSSVKVTFQNMQYNLPPWSISILPDCKNVVFNTARISSQSSLMKMIPVSSGSFPWQSYSEETPSSDQSDTLAMDGLWEQLNVTKDVSDYLWYLTEVNIASDEGFLKNGENLVLTVMSAGHALSVFINGQLSGTVYGGLENPKLTYSDSVKLRAGINKISLLSIAVGLPNVGLHFETWNAGVLGPVSLKGLNEGTRDLTRHKWSYKVGLKGEALSLHTISGSSSVEWVEGSLVAQNQPLTWYKTSFNAPRGDDPLALDMSSMGKGQIWINGKGIGRHWPGYIAHGSCSDCWYAGTYDEKKCQSNCGEPSQRWYHVPRSWLKPGGNLLVVFEEWGGNPTQISLVRRTTERVCVDIFEEQPTPQNWNMLSSRKVNSRQPKAHLWCAPGQKISKIQFASYGMPQGTYGSFKEGSCHAHKSYVAVEKV
ncbi:unnamed protein product [Ilex paraguariensis]|uniref:beta-galactosidase n=1 Tax=Ilex paraguariensis TaxID=185542 RepID=A0ABC8QQG8_9AQUA